MKFEIGLLFTAFGMGVVKGGLDALRSKMRVLGETVKRDTTEYQRLGETIKRTAEGRALDRLRAKQERLRRSIIETRQEMRRMAMEDLKGRWADGLATVGSLMAARRVAFAQNAPETALRNVAITVGVARTEDEARLGQIAERSARDARLSLDQVHQGMGALAAGGMDAVEDFERAVPVLGRATKAWGASMEGMANTLLVARNSLKITDDARALNIIGTGGKLGKFEIPDLARFLPSLAPTVAGLGMTGNKGLAETVGYLQAAREGAGTSEEAATNFANFLAKVTSREFSDRWKDLTNRDLAADQQALLGQGYDVIGGTLKLIRDYMAGNGQDALIDALATANGDAEIEAAIEALQGAHGLGELFTDMQASKFIRAAMMYGDLQKQVARAALAGNPLDKDFEDALDTTDTRLQRLGGAWEGVLRRISVALKPVTDAALDAGAWLLEGIAKVADAVPRLTRGIVLLGAALAALKTGRMAVGIFTALWRVLALGSGGGLIGGLLRMRTLLPIIAGAWGPTAVLAWTRSLFLAGGGLSILRARLMLSLGPIWAFSAALLASPITWVVGGLVLLAGAAWLIYKNWDRIVAWIGPVWSDVWDGVVTHLGGAVHGVVEWIKKGGAWLKEAFLNWTPLGLLIKHWDEISTFFSKLPSRMVQAGKAIIGGLVAGIQESAAELKRTIVGLGDSAIQWFRGKLDMHSPSRVFATLGEAVGDGLALGIGRSEHGVLRRMDGMASRLAAVPLTVGALTVGAATAAPHEVATPPATAGIEIVMPASTAPTFNINVTVHGQADGQDIADRIRREVDDLLRDRSSREQLAHRSRLFD